MSMESDLNRFMIFSAFFSEDHSNWSFHVLIEESERDLPVTEKGGAINTNPSLG